MPYNESMLFAWNHSAGKFQPVRMDSDLKYLGIIEAEHALIHMHKHFFAGYSVANIGAQADPADAMTITFTTPASPIECHLIWDAYAGGEANLVVREAPTGGAAGGTALTAHNNYRPASETSQLSGLVYNASVATGGTVLENEYFGQQTRLHGESRGMREVVLKVSTKYQVALISALNVTASISIAWYEIED